jgi:hypothetical protein
MANPLGYSFAPNFDNAEQGRRGGSPATTPQTPLQTLSFRLPKFKGAGGGLSPLQGTSAGSSLSRAVLESVLRTVLGSGAMEQALGAPPASSRVPVPGVEPTAIDTGRVAEGVRGPGRPQVDPSYEAPSFSAPSPFRPMERDPAPAFETPQPPRAPVIRPGDDEERLGIATEPPPAVAAPTFDDFFSKPVRDERYAEFF